LAFPLEALQEVRPLRRAVSPILRLTNSALTCCAQELPAGDGATHDFEAAPDIAIHRPSLSVLKSGAVSLSMKSRHLFKLNVLFLLISNSTLVLMILFLLISSAYQRREESRSGAGTSASSIQFFLLQQARGALSILQSELEETERDTKFIAELASHIFTHPESFRLAAQPGEYDYDQQTRLYGSARNDGTSLLLLSAVTELNSDILLDIRLSEYLNPVFKGVLSLRSSYLEIGLYTVDSLIRVYPWIDIQKKISTGLLKRNFKANDFVFFDKATPEKNSLKKPVWTMLSGEAVDPTPKAFCSAPFDSGGVFKGVIVIGLSLGKTSSRSFENVDSKAQLAFFLSKQNQILSMNQILEPNLRSRDYQARSMSQFPFSKSARIQKIIQRLPSATSEHFEKVSDFYIQVLPSGILPIKFVTLLPVDQAARLGFAPSAPWLSQKRGWAIWGGVVLLVFSLCGSLWVVKFQRDLENSSRQLALSFSVLENLNLDSVGIGHQEGILGDLFQKFESSVEALRIHLESLATGVAGHSVDGVPDLSAPSKDVEAVLGKMRVLSCFEAGDSMETGLSRLVAFLGEFSQADRICFMFYSAGEKLLRSSGVGHGFSAVTLEKLTVAVSEGSFFERVLASDRVVYTNSFSLSLTPADSETLSGLILRNILICPLTDQETVFGLVLAGDKKNDFDSEDQSRFQALQETISKCVKNLLQFEGYRNIDLLRRQYCTELARAVEAPLNRIKGEVQSIYSRLGKLTPYYKQHCETILFEVGRLYEITSEAGEFDHPSLKPPS
jgi:hypothetical protein